MIKFYYHPSPNPAKVALFLEESGLEYEVVPVDTRKGEQHSPSYLAINPNAKTPSIVDGEATVFDSSAILLYLAEKTGRFLPENTPKARGELFSWLFFVSSGVGPYSGQSFHFNVAAPEKIEYAINRYNFETHRHWKILDDRLGRTEIRARRHLHDRGHVDLGLELGCSLPLGRGDLVKDGQCEAARRRDQRTPRRRSRQQVEGKACLQARVRRRGQAAFVSASDKKAS